MQSFSSVLIKTTYRSLNHTNILPIVNGFSKIRHYSNRSNDDVQERLNRLRENFGNNIENNENDTDLSKEIMQRMNNLRSKAPNVHDLDTNVDELYTTKRPQNEEQKQNTIEINGRTIPISIPRDQVEIVRSSDY